MERKKRILIVVITIAVIAASICYYAYKIRQDSVKVIAAGSLNNRQAPKLLDEAAATTELATTEAAATAESGQRPAQPAAVRVHITGEVRNPGVYEVPEGSRVVDVIQEAGGETKDADMSVNLARAVSDGEQIVIPKTGETVDKNQSMEQNNNVEQDVQEAPRNAEGGQENNSPIVNINTATAAELMALPGIGETTALNIIRYREKNGAFTKKSEIMNVSRIGQKLYEQLEELITVE